MPVCVGVVAEIDRATVNIDPIDSHPVNSVPAYRESAVRAKLRRAMDKFDRIFQLHAILASRRTAIPLADLMARLECSKSTLLRAINTLKNQLNAPVVFDAAAGGYKYGNPEGQAFELPGLWFNANELQALAIMQRLLKDAGGGLLEEHLGRSRSG